MLRAGSGGWGVGGQEAGLVGEALKPHAALPHNLRAAEVAAVQGFGVCEWQGGAGAAGLCVVV